jgi:hypothetical protein
MKKKKLVSRPQDQILEGGTSGGGLAGLKGFTGGKKELFKSTVKKARTATVATAVASKAVDEWEELNSLIFEKPYNDAIERVRWGRGNLITHRNRPEKFANGEIMPQPQKFYHGSPTFIKIDGKRQFADWQPNNAGKPYEARDKGYYGSGSSFTSNPNDAVIYKNSKDEQWNEIRSTEIQEIRDANGGLYEPEIVEVYLAPESPLHIAVYGWELGWIRDPKDYKRIIAATQRVILREIKNLPKKEGDELIASFHRKVIETQMNAGDLITQQTVIGDAGNFGLESRDPAQLLPGQKPYFPEETWRWKNRHPTRRGELNMEELASFVQSGDFTEIAREGGYSASLIQYHADSTKVKESGVPQDEFDPEAYHEVIIYGPKQIKGTKNKGTYDDSENLNTQYSPTKLTKVA